MGNQLLVCVGGGGGGGGREGENYMRRRCDDVKLGFP